MKSTPARESEDGPRNDAAGIGNGIECRLEVVDPYHRERSGERFAWVTLQSDIGDPIRRCRIGRSIGNEIPAECLGVESRCKLVRRGARQLDIVNAWSRHLSVAPDKSGKAALDLHSAWIVALRLILPVGGIETDHIALPAEGLESRLLIVD